MLGFAPLCQFSLAQTAPTVTLTSVTGISLTIGVGLVINVENASASLTGVSLTVNAGNESISLWTPIPNPAPSVWTEIPNPA